MTSTPRCCWVFSLLALAGCDNPFNSGECALVVRPAVTIEVRERGSGQPLADSASGVAQTGTYTDSLRPFAYDSLPSGKLAALQGFGPAGVYHVELQRPGYASWTTDGVRVTANRCGDNTVALRADLVPLSTK